ncbi:MAG TPA: guanylate kinase, partial [Mycobacterium sp.]|nr:guanylate kinase [Mycobacterium sp.]
DFDRVVVNSELESACSELVSLLVETAPDRHDPSGQTTSQQD